MAWVTPKTNWSSNESYNYQDWNRVLNNLQEVYLFYQNLKYTLPAMTFSDTISAYGEMKYLSDVNSIESRLNTIKQSTLTPLDWQESIVWSATTTFSSSAANRWEENTKRLWDLGGLIVQGARRCGTSAAGGAYLPQ